MMAGMAGEAKANTNQTPGTWLKPTMWAVLMAGPHRAATSENFIPQGHAFAVQEPQMASGQIAVRRQCALIAIPVVGLTDF
jgi:hypothetical protein